MATQPYFSSDWHYRQSNWEILDRPFDSLESMEQTIFNNMMSIKGCERLYFLGDICKNTDEAVHLEVLEQYVKPLPYPKTLVKGNHDTLSDNIYRQYFDQIIPLGMSMKHPMLATAGIPEIYLTHKPVNAAMNIFSLLGHIHRDFLFQRNCLNVGTDANHFRAWSLEKVIKKYNSIKNYHDINSFAGELPTNRVTM